MKKVCFFNSISFWGGGEKLNLEYALEFKRKGFEVIGFTNENSELTKRLNQSGIETVSINVSNQSFLNLPKLHQLKRLFRQHQIDTVIFSNSHDVKTGGIAAKMAGIERIVYYRSIAVPVSGSIVNRYVFKSCLTHIVANSNETKRLILQKQPYLNPESVKTIYYGIDFDKFNPAFERSFFREDRKVILGNAGRLTTQKGQHLLIDIAKELKNQGIDFILKIAGTGELYDQLNTSIKDNNLEDQVQLLGFVEDMESFMEEIDIFLLTSQWEGFGYVLAEAMIKSCPVVAFDITSNPEVVIQDKTGFLVPFPNTNAFSEKVIHLIQHPQLLESMGTYGKESVVSRFTLSDKVDELIEYISSK